MLNGYNILKYAHVLSVVIWIGGITGLAVATWRVAKERNRAFLAALVKQSVTYGQWVVGPAAGLVLLTGLAMVGMGHIGFGTFWVWFGYAGVLVHAILGGFILRRRAEAVLRLASGGAGDDVAMVAAARRLWNTQLVYLVLLAIVIAGMVIKPVP